MGESHGTLYPKEAVKNNLRENDAGHSAPLSISPRLQDSPGFSSDLVSCTCPAQVWSQGPRGSPVPGARQVCTHVG